MTVVQLAAMTVESIVARLAQMTAARLVGMAATCWTCGVLLLAIHRFLELENALLA
jgi:hypothetical protein